MAFISGKTGKVRYGGGATVLKVKKWSATYKGQKLDVTNSESAGFGEYIGGILDLDFTIEGDYNLDSPLAFFAPGTVQANNVTMYLNDTTGVKWIITTPYIESFENTTDVRGLVSFKIVGCGSAAFSVPAN